jgi:signal transduction histidine kinase
MAARLAVVTASALALAMASALIVVTRDVPSSYAAADARLAALDLTAGIGLIIAGVLVARMRDDPAGPVAMALGAVWLAPDWVGWEEGPPLVRSAAMVVSPFLIALVIHLALVTRTGPTAGFRTSSARLVVGFGYATVAVISLARAVVRDPFLDPHCWNNCRVNVFLVQAAPDAAARLVAAMAVVTMIAALGLGAATARYLLVASRPACSDAWPVLVPCSVVASGEAIYALALWVDPAEDPTDPRFRWIFVARALAMIGLGAGLLATVVRQVRTHAALARLAEDLGAAPAPGTLRDKLARALGDPGLQVGYPQAGPARAGSEGYVDSEGRPLAPVSGSRVSTPIVRNGEPVALVLHESATRGARGFEREIGAAARVAVDNERLRAGVLAQLEELRASWARIVQEGDTARRRLERDLHDGAQQRLLALSYELRLAHAAAEAAGDRATVAVLGSAVDEARAAIRELRELAHGIHPVILTDAGLGPALESLAAGAPVPVELSAVPGERFPEAVERAVYVVVATAIDEAARTAAAGVAVAVSREANSLIVRASPAPADSVKLADRVGALGGQVDTGEGELRAEIPCA